MAPQPHELYLLASESKTDPRTIRRILEGKGVREMSRARVLLAVERLGLQYLLASVDGADAALARATACKRRTATR